MTIASRGEILTLSSTAIMGKPFSNRFSYRLRADTFFALFPPADEYRRVYYYYHAVSYKYPVWYVLYFGENGKAKIDRLWVLVNEQTGTVEDYAFKRYGEDTVFGRLPQAKGDGYGHEQSALFYRYAGRNRIVGRRPS